MVGWLRSIPTDRSQTHASPPAWLATTLSSRSLTGSDSALSLTASSAAASAVSGCRAKRGESAPDASVSPSA